MAFFYPVFISFILVFLSELGDKTQLLVLSFSTKTRSRFILLGVALGSFLSHGIAILFGSSIGSLENNMVHDILQFITYVSFIFFGIATLVPKKEPVPKANNGVLHKIAKIKMHYVFLVAFSIAIGELGDKTFLASIGLGIQYPWAKLHLIIGAILGMLASDVLAIIIGKYVSKKISEKTVNTLSGIIFLLFGILGFISFFQNIF